MKNNDTHAMMQAKSISIIIIVAVAITAHMFFIHSLYFILLIVYCLIMGVYKVQNGHKS